ncbi:MAG TPA: LLM class flavin-dependent oxidoreductase, partial [Actinomycetota bacterium]
MADPGLRIGAQIPTRETYIRNLGAAPLLDFARAAAAEGFDSLWAGDSLLARPRAEPLTILAAVAAAYPGVTIGTAALMGALRQPLLAAHSIATLDQLAEGRLILGLGAGAPVPQTQHEMDAAGARFDRRVSRLMETVAIWRALWDPDRDPAQPLRFEGKHWSFERIESLPRPHRLGGPPLWLAGGGERALRRAGESFDGWIPYPPSADDYSRGLATASQAAADAGRDPSEFTPALYVTVNLGEPEAAHAELEHYVSEYYAMPLELMSTLQAFYAGNAEGCVEWIRGYVDAGARHIVIR